MLIRWRSSVKNLGLFLDVHLEVLFGIPAFEFIGETSFYGIFLLVQEVLELGSELSSRNDTGFVSFLSNTNFTCNFEGCFLVVTGEDPSVGSCVVESVNRFNNTLSQRVDKANGSN